MEREYKIYENGNKCAIIEEHCDYYDFSFRDIAGDTGFGILSCNLRDYSLEFNNANLKTERDIFDWVIREKKVKTFKFSIEDLVKGYGSDTYIDYTGEELTIDVNKEYSVEEMRDLLYDMNCSECFDEGIIYNIINQIEFENFIIRPFYAYIHSGITVSLGDFCDPWDSGMAGFAWYEPYDGETMEEAEVSFKNMFSTYDDYVIGYYNEYHFMDFEKKDGKWIIIDDVWSFEKSFDDAWECFDFPPEKEYPGEVDSFSEEDKDIVRKNIEIGTNEILDYLTEECGY